MGSTSEVPSCAFLRQPEMPFRRPQCWAGLLPHSHDGLCGSSGFSTRSLEKQQMKFVSFNMATSNSDNFWETLGFWETLLFQFLGFTTVSEVSIWGNWIYLNRGRKPSGAFKDNVQADLMVKGRRLLQTCTSDGYTRVLVNATSRVLILMQCCWNKWSLIVK